MQILGIGFLVLLFVEIISIVVVAGWVGGGLTLVLMIASAVLGVFMLRRMGLSGVMLAMTSMKNQGQLSLYELLLPIRYAVAAILLISPGFVSTVLAVILLLPFKGKPITQQQQGQSFQGFSGFGYTQQNAKQNDDIIEGEFTVEDDATSQTHQNKPQNKRLLDQ
ncbi:MAG: FxsA family protein [Neisseria sp.]|nr:FxsA family protein [Neisseria sp.]